MVQRYMDIYYVTGAIPLKPIHEVREMSFEEIQSLVKGVGWDLGKRIITSGFENLTDEFVAGTLYSARRATCKPDEIDPVEMLGHIRVARPITDFDEHILPGLESLMEEKVPNANDVKFHDRLLISNKATIEFSGSSGGFNLGYQMFCASQPRVLDLTFVIEWESWCIADLETRILDYIDERIVPFVYFTDICELGNKHRLPGVLEFPFAFLGHRLGRYLRPVLHKITGRTFTRKDYEFDLRKVKWVKDSFFNSTDASNSTDNPTHHFWRGLLHYLVDRLSHLGVLKENLPQWHRAIEIMVGPHYIITDGGLVKKYRKSLLVPKRRKFTGSTRNCRFLEDFRKRYNQKHGVIHPITDSVVDDQGFATIEYVGLESWEDQRTQLANGIRFMSQNGTFMSYSFTSVLLPFLTALPLYLNPCKALAYIMTGDDNVSLWRSLQEILDHSEFERKCDYDVNDDKTVKSKNGYIIAENIFVLEMLPEPHLRKAKFAKLKGLWPQGARNPQISLPKMLCTWEAIYPKKFVLRCCELIFQRYKTFYMDLHEAGVPLSGPIGLFPEIYIPFKGAPLWDLKEQGRFNEAYALYSAPRSKRSIFVSQHIDQLEQFIYEDSFDVRYGDPEETEQFAIPEVIPRGEFLGLADVLLTPATSGCRVSEKEEKISSSSVIRKWEKLSGERWLTILPDKVKTYIRTDLPGLVRGLPRVPKGTTLKANVFPEGVVVIWDCHYMTKWRSSLSEVDQVNQFIDLHREQIGDHVIFIDSWIDAPNRVRVRNGVTLTHYHLPKRLLTRYANLLHNNGYAFFGEDFEFGYNDINLREADIHFYPEVKKFFRVTEKHDKLVKYTETWNVYSNGIVLAGGFGHRYHERRARVQYPAQAFSTDDELIQLDREDWEHGMCIVDNYYMLMPLWQQEQYPVLPSFEQYEDPYTQFDVQDYIDEGDN